MILCSGAGEMHNEDSPFHSSLSISLLLVLLPRSYIHTKNIVLPQNPPKKQVWAAHL